MVDATLLRGIRRETSDAGNEQYIGKWPALLKAGLVPSDWKKPPRVVTAGPRWRNADGHACRLGRVRLMDGKEPEAQFWRVTIYTKGYNRARREPCTPVQAPAKALDLEAITAVDPYRLVFSVNTGKFGDDGSFEAYENRTDLMRLSLRLGQLAKLYQMGDPVRMTLSVADCELSSKALRQPQDTRKSAKIFRAIDALWCCLRCCPAEIAPTVRGIAKELCEMSEWHPREWPGLVA